MDKKFRKALFLIISIAMLYVFFLTINSLNYNNFSYNLYVNNGFKDTQSKNLITAIYLNYRLFDSIFESSILFIAAIGISFMGSKYDDTH